MVAGDGKVPILGPVKRDYRFFKRGDLDALPALFFDNLSSLIGILLAMTFVPVLASSILGDGSISPAHIGAFEDMIFGRVSPALALALAFGNIWYGWMAFKLAAYEERDDVTALPYGINTPAGFIMAFSVMLPLCLAFSRESDPIVFADRVWSAACSANFVGGMFEVAGFWVGNPIRYNTSKAALYAPIASVGFVFLAYAPIVGVGSEPIIGMIPLALCFTGFFANKGKGIYKSGATAVLIFLSGTVLKWVGAGRYQGTIEEQGAAVTGSFTRYAGANSMAPPGTSLAGFPNVGDYMAIVFPVALQSFVETMENVEAASAKGDHYNIMEAMIVDGLGTMVGAFFGSPIPTTVYIGHARHKIVGAAAGYSLMNALIYVIILMSGLFPVVVFVVDPISIGCVLIFVGLMIVQQSFEVSASRHYPALCIGLMMVISDYIRVNANDQRPGIRNLSAGGGIMASLIVTQIICDLTDLRFDRCAFFTLIAIVFSVFGIMHGNNPVPVNPNDAPPELGELTVSFADGTSYIDGMNEGWRFAVAYTMLLLFCAGHYAAQRMGYIDAAITDNGAAPGTLPTVEVAPEKAGHV